MAELKATGDMILRKIAGENLLVPVGAAAQRLRGMINLNDSGLLLWEALQTDCTKEMLVDTLTAEYEVDRATAEADVQAFLDALEQAGALA